MDRASHMPAGDLFFSETGPFSRRVYIFMACIVLFGLIIAPYSGVHLPRFVMLTIGIIGLLMLLVMTLTKTDYLILLLVCYIPFSKILVGSFGGMLKGVNLFNVLFFFIVVSWIINKERRRGSDYHTSLDFLLVIFIMLAMVSLIRGGMRAGNNLMETFVVDIKRWMSPIMLYFLIVHIVDNNALRKDIIILMMFAVFVVGMLGLKEYYIDQNGGGTWESVRIEGIAQQANQLGAFFVYYTPFLVAFFFMHLKDVKHWMLSIPLLVCVRALMLTISRAAFLSFGMGWYVFIFLRSKVLFFLLLLGTTVIILNPQILPETVRGRFEGIIDERRIGVDSEFNPEHLEGSARLRVYALQAGIQMIKDYPLLGIGYNMFPLEVCNYTFMVYHGFDTHNSYLTIATEMGIPALIVFLMILTTIFLNTVNVYRHSDDHFIKVAALGWSMGVVGVFISNLFGSRLEALELSGYFWMVSAIFMCESEIIKKQRRKINRMTLRDEDGGGAG